MRLPLKRPGQGLGIKSIGAKAERGRHHDRCSELIDYALKRIDFRSQLSEMRGAEMLLDGET